MKKDYTHIDFILDRSGSVESIKEDIIGGFNSFVEDQKKVRGTATISLYQFDDKFQTDYEFKDINSVRELNTKTFVPRGWTALYDAIGRTIKSTGEILAKTPESLRPSKVIVVIMTDGQENFSKEFSAKDVKKLITEQTNKYNWEFVFIGANQDVVLTGRTLGIQPRNTVYYTADSFSVGSTYSNLSKNIASSRLGNSVNYSSEDNK